MYTANDFLRDVFQISALRGYVIEINRDGLRQIDFGHKKLHEEHLRRLYPNILRNNADISALIKIIAPGRPCSHRPMKIIIAELLRRRGNVIRNLAARSSPINSGAL
jgi:hypothetical protein